MKQNSAELWAKKDNLNHDGRDEGDPDIESMSRYSSSRAAKGNERACDATLAEPDELEFASAPHITRAASMCLLEITASKDAAIYSKHIPETQAGRTWWIRLNPTNNACRYVLTRFHNLVPNNSRNTAMFTVTLSVT